MNNISLSFTKVRNRLVLDGLIIPFISAHYLYTHESLAKRGQHKDYNTYSQYLLNPKADNVLELIEED